MKISMYGRKVLGSFKVSRFDVKEVTSQIGDIPRQALQTVKDLATPLLEKIANLVLKKGLKVPTFEGLRLIRPRLTLLDRSVLIESDLVYKTHYGRKIIGPYKSLLQRSLKAS